jgi:hypothetical protein
MAQIAHEMGNGIRAQFSPFQYFAPLYEFYPKRIADLSDFFAQFAALLSHKKTGHLCLLESQR